MSNQQKAPTAAQKKAAGRVREYLRAKHLEGAVDEDEAQDDGVIRIELSDRDERDISDEFPCVEMRNVFRDHVTNLRDVSPLVFVSEEYVDEWIHLSITVRPTKRKPRPHSIPNLTAKLIERMPKEIVDHPAVQKVRPRAHSTQYEGVEVTTAIPGEYHGMTRNAALGWDLRGNTIDGWELVLDWGCHRIRRPATFKKLTPKIILAQLQKILAKMDDPMNCLGYTIHIKKDETYLQEAMTSKPKRGVFQMYSVRSQDGKKVKACRGGTSVVFVNNLTGEERELNVGDDFPEELDELNLS